jgi:hypothetical protein
MQAEPVGAPVKPKRPGSRLRQRDVNVNIPPRKAEPKLSQSHNKRVARAKGAQRVAAQVGPSQDVPAVVTQSLLAVGSRSFLPR